MMNLISFAWLAGLGAFLAFVIERAITIYSRRLSDDASWIQAAIDAHDEQVGILAQILERGTISEEVKSFLIDVSEMSLNRNVALRLMDCIEMNEVQPETPEESRKLSQAIADISLADKDGYELVTGFLRVSMLAAFLQWRDTARRLVSISPRLASEAADEMISSTAVAISRSVGKPDKNFQYAFG